MCNALKLPRSTYYWTLVRVPSKRKQEYQKFAAEVKSTFQRIEKYMESLSFRVLLSKKVLNTASGVFSDICKIRAYVLLQSKDIIIMLIIGKYLMIKKLFVRYFSTFTINEKWVTDITYIHAIRRRVDISGICYGSL